MFCQLGCEGNVNKNKNNIWVTAIVYSQLFLNWLKKKLKNFTNPHKPNYIKIFKT